MARADALLATVGRLYAAAREPSGWMAALESVTELLGAGHTILVAGNPFDGGFALGAGVDDRAVNDALTIEPGDLRDGLNLDELPDGVVLRRSRLIPDREFVRTHYYNTFIRPLGGFHSLFYRRALPGGGLVLAVCRPPQAEDFDRAREAALAALLPHLDNAVDLHHRLRTAERRDGGLIRLLDGLPNGVILADASGRPLYMNRPAERLVDAADGLMLAPGGLAAASYDATRRLRATVAEVGMPRGLRIHGVASGSGIGVTRVRLCLERPSGRPPLLVTVLPFWSLGDGDGGGEPRAAVFIDEPGAPVRIDRAALAEAFRLTRREVEVAGLIGEGQDLAAAARRLGLGLGTARNHLKRVFEKTGAHGQAALVALVRGYGEPRR